MFLVGVKFVTQLYLILKYKKKKKINVLPFAEDKCLLILLTNDSYSDKGWKVGGQ